MNTKINHINPENSKQAFYHYDLRERDKFGINEHPQTDIKMLSQSVGFKILDCIPQSLGDRWDIWIQFPENEPELPDYFCKSDWEPIGQI